MKPSLGSTQSPGYSPELDTLRALAIASVLVNHFLDGSILDRTQLALLPETPLGVPLFFALSGFLITRILVQSRAAADLGKTTTRHSFYIFYARRFLRIFPLYYAALAFGAVFNFTNVRHALPWHLGYLSNFYYSHRQGFDRGPAPVFWTLSVEEQFYLVWPLMILLLPVRWLPKLMLITAAVGAVFSGWASMQPAWYGILTPAYLHYLALGSYLGLSCTAPFAGARPQHKVMNGSLIAVIAVAVVMTIVHFALPDNYLRAGMKNGGRSLISALVFSWIVAKLARGVGGILGRMLRCPPVVYIGRISYGIYVLQFFVTQTMDRAVPKISARIGSHAASWLLQSAAMRIVAIVAVASVSYLLFEKPINDLKRFFPYSRARSGANQTAHAGV